MVYAYTLLWRKPMSFYTVIMQSAAFFLIPVGILLIGNGGSLPLVLADFIFYLLISPTFTLILMRSMYFQQNTMIAKQAIDRIDNLSDFPAMDYSTGEMQVPEHSLAFKNVSFSYDGADSPRYR